MQVISRAFVPPCNPTRTMRHDPLGCRLEPARAGVWTYRLVRSAALGPDTRCQRTGTLATYSPNCRVSRRPDGAPAGSPGQTFSKTEATTMRRPIPLSRTCMPSRKKPRAAPLTHIGRSRCAIRVQRRRSRGLRHRVAARQLERPREASPRAPDCWPIGSE
jgi:hypothetical protein